MEFANKCTNKDPYILGLCFGINNAILLPSVNKVTWLKSDEAIIFEIYENKEEKQAEFKIVEDEALEDEVYKEYLRLYGEANPNAAVNTVPLDETVLNIDSGKRDREEESK